MLVRDGDRLRFSHPCLPRSWRTARRRPIGARVHARLARSAPDQEQRARHLAAAAPSPDEDVAAVLEAAAVEARRRAATGGRRGAGRASGRADAGHGPAAKLRRLLAAADAVMVVEDGPRSRRLLEDALARAERRPGARRGAPQARVGRDRRQRGRSLSERALGEAGDDDRCSPTSTFGRGLHLDAGRVAEGARHSEAAVGTPSGRRPVPLAKALSDLAFYRSLGRRGRPAGALCARTARARGGGAQP